MQSPITRSVILLGCFLPALLGARTAEQWEVVDFPFVADAPAAGLVDPFAVEFWATFTGEDGQSMRIPGFFNGGREWIIRFCPPATGDWTYTTFSSRKELSGLSGSLTVNPNTRDWQRGPIVIPEGNPQRFAYADGTPYFLVAFELDWIFALDAENPADIPLTRSLVKDVADHGFNQIVMNVFAYDANWGEREKAKPEHRFDRPTVFPFGGNNEDPDFSILDVEYFQRLDRVIAHLDEQAIVAHLMIYVWNKKVNWPEPESEADNRFFDYVVKRYQAYPNLIWDISKEALAYGRDDMGYITRRIERLKQLDGHDRLLSVHDYNYCNAFPDMVDFISIQEWEPYLYYRMVEVAQKHANEPVFNIEHGGYEKTTYSIFDGAYTDPVACLDRNYQCVFAGVYSTYYWQNTSWYNVITEPFALPKAEQPHFHYYRHLIELFTRYNYNTLVPRQNPFSSPMLTNGEDLYLFYMPEDRLGIFGALNELKGKVMQITWFNPLTGEYIDAGEYDFTSNTWMQVKRPPELTSPMGVVIFEAK